MSITFEKLEQFIRSLYNTEDVVPLHAPVFAGNEYKYLKECIDTTFVSYVGKFVDRFEQVTAEFTGAKHAVATVNGTSALQIALIVAGVRPEEEVITQALTFVATVNAIKHAGADPVFVDVEKNTLGMAPESLELFLAENAEITGKICINKKSGRRIGAVIPVHIFGHPCRIQEIIRICDKYKIPVVEDAAESLGSFYNGKHTGTFGKLGVFSYNGNKTVTTGGGGMIVTDDPELASRAKHLTTTGKVTHPWEYIHDTVAFNFRMPNVNAAIGCAQMEKLNEILSVKRSLAEAYRGFCSLHNIEFVSEPKNSCSNYWLNTLILSNREERDSFLRFMNGKRVMTRPVWELMNRLNMYRECQSTPLINSEWLADRLVNLPSSVIKSRL